MDQKNKETVIYKKPYETVDNVDESMWFSNDTPVMESDFTFVFDDRYPCVEGHRLFIPKENNRAFTHFHPKTAPMSLEFRANAW